MSRKTRLRSFQPEPTRQFLSLWASRFFEKSGIKRLFGFNLAAAMFVAGVLTPEASSLLSKQTVEDQITSTPISAETQTLSTFETPLTSFNISQRFTSYHPGIDMATEIGSPIYAIESGTVEAVESAFFGYGKHVIIAHDRGIKSLYGHMSEIKTWVGKQVTRGELIGLVGSTGWSTGNHLHLEIIQDGKYLSPLEVLSISPSALQPPITTKTTESSESTGSGQIPDWAVRPAITTSSGQLKAE